MLNMHKRNYYSHPNDQPIYKPPRPGFTFRPGHCPWISSTESPLLCLMLLTITSHQGGPYWKKKERVEQPVARGGVKLQVDGLGVVPKSCCLT